MLPACPPHRSRSSALLLLGLFSPLAAAQTPDSEATPTSVALQPALQISASRAAFGVGEDGGRQVGGGPDYKVELLPGGFEFTPALGRAVETNRSLTWHLDSISREGGQVLSADRSLRPALDGAQAIWSREAGIQERLEFSPEGVELSYLFPVRPAGRGDLIVRGALATNLALPNAHGSDGSLEFIEPGAGGLTIGQVFGIDAEGVTVTGTTRLVDGALELVLPGAFVDSAAYPLLLDPFIGTTDIVAENFDEGDPDLAYDEDADEFLVVWERGFSASDFDVRGQRLNGSANPIGGLVFIESTNDIGFNPCVGNAGPAGAYVVAWQESSGIFGPYDIRARAVEAGTGAFGIATTVNTAAASAFGADISDSTTDNRLLVVWTDDTGGIRGRIPQVVSNLELSFGVFGDTVPFSISTNSEDSAPAVSKSGSESGLWAVVWQRRITTTTPSNRQIAARMVRFDSVAITNEAVVGFSTRDEETPDVDGDGGRFMAVYRRDESSSSSTGDIVTRPLSWSGSSTIWGNAVIAHGDSNDNESRPVIAYTGDAYVVAWQDAFSNPPFEVRAVVVDEYQGAPCGNDFGVPSVGVGEETTPAIVSKHKGFQDSDPRVLIGLLHETTTGANESIQAALFDTAVGQIADLGGDCFGAGSYDASCLVAGETSKHELRFAEPSSPVYLIGSAPTPAFFCGSCTLHVNPFVGFLQSGFTNFDGRDQIDITIPPGLQGTQLHMQWAIPDATPGCSTFSVDLSNALDLTIQ